MLSDLYRTLSSGHRSHYHLHEISCDYLQKTPNIVPADVPSQEERMVRVIVHHLGASLLSTPFQLYVILSMPMVLGGDRVYRTCKVCQRRGPSARRRLPSMWGKTFQWCSCFEVVYVPISNLYRFSASKPNKLMVCQHGLGQSNSWSVAAALSGMSRVHITLGKICIAVTQRQVMRNYLEGQRQLKII